MIHDMGLRLGFVTCVAAFVAVMGRPLPAGAVVVDVTIDGSDAIFIAGRTDLLPIPPLDEMHLPLS